MRWRIGTLGALHLCIRQKLNINGEAVGLQRRLQFLHTRRKISIACPPLPEHGLNQRTEILSLRQSCQLRLQLLHGVLQANLSRFRQQLAPC